MKTSVIEVHDMLSVLSVQGVEQRIGEVPGVESVTVNFAAGKATVRYDETQLELADIKSDVRQRGFEADAKSSSAMPAGDKGDSAPNTTDGSAVSPIAPKTRPISADAAPEDNASHVESPAEGSVTKP